TAVKEAYTHPQPHRKHRMVASGRQMVSVQGQSLYGGSRGFVRVESQEEQPPLREVQGSASGVKLVSTLPPGPDDGTTISTTATAAVMGVSCGFRKVQVRTRFTL
ncbi:unnamed protein product, partial [Laminaria digitata]